MVVRGCVLAVVMVVLAACSKAPADGSSSLSTATEDAAPDGPVVRAEADAAHGGRVVTEVEPRRNHWRAEDYHQHYYARHPWQGYCAHVIAPKVDKFRRTFAARVQR